MNMSLNRILLAAGHSNLAWFPWTRLRPSAEERLGWGWVGWHMISGFFWAGLPILLLARGFARYWSFSALWIPGLFGAVAAGLWFGMIRQAWNRRVAAAASGAGEIRLSSMERWLALPALGVLVLVLSGSLVVALENLRGIWLLRSVEAELRARGQATTLAEVVPPAVPDERNLAKAPFLAPLFAYEIRKPQRGDTNGAVRWLDPAGFQRAQNFLQIEAGRPTFLAFASEYRRSHREMSKNQNAPATERASDGPAPELGHEVWSNGTAVNLPMWQAYYRSLTNANGVDAAATPAKEVLRFLDRQGADYELLATALKERPQCRFPIRYEDGSMTVLPPLAPMKRFTLFLRLRAVALLADGRSEEAFLDTKRAMQLSDGLLGEPILICLLVRAAMNNLAMQPLWEGCRDQRWNDAQLATFQEILGRRDDLGELQKVLVGERVVAGVAYDAMASGSGAFNSQGIIDDSGVPSDDFSLKMFLTLMPRGWVRQSQVTHIQYVQALVDDLARARTYADLTPSDQLLDRYIKRNSLFNVLAAMLAPAVRNAADRMYEQEAWRRLALVGLALERHRLAEGRYPETLDALVPRFLAVVPLDPMDGKPVRYARVDETHFRLYSIGRDGSDDGGKRALRRARSSADPKRASDLVWR